MASRPPLPLNNVVNSLILTNFSQSVGFVFVMLKATLYGGEGINWRLNGRFLLILGVNKQLLSNVPTNFVNDCSLYFESPSI